MPRPPFVRASEVHPAESIDHVGGVTVVVLTREELVAAMEAAVRRVLDAREQRAPQASAEWMTLEQAAEFLGYRPSYLRKRRDIPVHRVGRKRRYRRSELEAFVLAGR